MARAWFAGTDLVGVVLVGFNSNDFVKAKVQ